jgi:hypothetical protein
MSGFGTEGFGTARAVSVDVYTDAYRVAGTVETRFSRVAEILNQLTGAHLAIEAATITEYSDPGGSRVAPSALVAVDSILVMIVSGLDGGTSAEMRVPKRPVRAELSLPPLRITGRIHVAEGSRPIDGLLNMPDRFVAMTDASLTSGAHAELERRASVLAVRRDRAQVLLVADEERPDEPLSTRPDERDDPNELDAD